MSDILRVCVCPSWKCVFEGTFTQVANWRQTNKQAANKQTIGSAGPKQQQQQIIMGELVMFGLAFSFELSSALSCVRQTSGR